MIEITKAHELDIVELTEDLPEYGLRRGAQGTVVEVFDKPEEAYMVEFLEDSGLTSKIADWVKPEQIINIDAIAKDVYARALGYLEQGNMLEAARAFRRAIELIPSYIRALHESFRVSLAEKKDWQRFITAMRFVRFIDPSYEVARHNLAIAYLNYGVQEAESGNYETSLQLFQYALRVETPEHITNLIKENIAASHTALGVKANENGALELSRQHFEAAYTFLTDDKTRRNLGLAYYHLAIFYTNERNLQKAINCYEWAEDSGLIVPEILNSHACALAISGEIEEAILLMESAQALAPDDEVVRSNLAKMLHRKDAADFITEVPPLNFYQPSISAADFSVAA